jgi:hypothetical protein
MQCITSIQDGSFRTVTTDRKGAVVFVPPDGPVPRPWRYNNGMFMLTFFAHLMVGMFLVGLAGSAIVVVVSFIEDMSELFGK